MKTNLLASLNLLEITNHDPAETKGWILFRSPSEAKPLCERGKKQR